MEPQQKEQSPNIDSNNHRVYSEANSEYTQNSPQDSSNQPSQDSGNNIAKGQAKLGIVFKLFTKDPIAVVLYVFQGISWTTTVKGAHIIFPKANTVSLSLLGTSLQFKLIPFVLGSAVQLALIMLLIVRARSQSTVRRWFMIIILTAASSYTSFFCFYDALLGGELTENSPKKILAHESLKNQIYTPLQAEYENLQNQLLTTKKRWEDEVKGTRSGIVGIGYRAWELKQEQEEIENQLNQIEGIITNSNIAAAFTLSHEDIKKLSTKELYDLGLVAWSSIPAAHKNNSPKPQFSNYENPEAFLLPLERLQAGDKNALAALVIASFIDCSSLILGSIGDSFSLSKVFTIIVSGFIMNLKRLGATLRRTIDKESVPFETEVSQLSNSTQIIKLNSDIEGHEFLSKLLNSIEKIDDQTYIINYDDLVASDDKDKCTFYKLLLTRMEIYPFNWLEDYRGKEQYNFMGLGNFFGLGNQQNSDDANQGKPKKPKKQKILKIKKECKDAFLNWLTTEIENQINQEQVKTKGVAEIQLYANPTLRRSLNSEET
ncbi:MAG: hypothetical protein AB4352_11125 [Hormoscilla sp.]